jgi:hypothetical protein
MKDRRDMFHSSVVREGSHSLTAIQAARSNGDLDEAMTLIAESLLQFDWTWPPGFVEPGLQRTIEA